MWPVHVLEGPAWERLSGTLLNSSISEAFVTPPAWSCCWPSYRSGGPRLATPCSYSGWR